MLRPEVLRNKKDFTAVYNKGKSVGDRYVVVFFRKNQLDYNRTAFLASKKVGKSVHRNKAKRLMKEAFRDIKRSSEVSEGNDIIIIARNTINGAAYSQVRKSLKNALLRLNILKGELK